MFDGLTIAVLTADILRIAPFRHLPPSCSTGYGIPIRLA
jgi:hypothetical protein